MNIEVMGRVDKSARALAALPWIGSSLPNWNLSLIHI